MDKIHFLVLWLGSRCNLRCKNCGNLIPYIENTEYDQNKIIDNLKYITASVTVQNIQIQGGEPFLYKNLGLITRLCCENKNIGHIVIASNGSIDPPKQVIDVLAQYSEKIEVRYSLYECVDSTSRDKRIEELKISGASVGTYDFIFGNGKWFDSGGWDEEFNDDKNEVFRIYKDCANRHCWTLLDDYLVNCSKIYSLMRIRGPFEPDDNNMIDITRARLRGLDVCKILEEYDRRYVSEAPLMCGYCKGTQNYIDPGIQLSVDELKLYHSQHSDLFSVLAEE